MSLGKPFVGLKVLSIGLNVCSDDLNGLFVDDCLNGPSFDMKRPSIGLKELLADLGPLTTKSCQAEKATDRRRRVSCRPERELCPPEMY